MNELALSVISVRENAREVMVQFLRTELAAARTLCHLARVHRHSGSADERLRMAQKALDAVSRFMWTARLEPQELNHVTAQLELLRFELESIQLNAHGTGGGAAMADTEVADVKRVVRPSLAIHPD